MPQYLADLACASTARHGSWPRRPAPAELEFPSTSLQLYTSEFHGRQGNSRRRVHGPETHNFKVRGPATLFLMILTLKHFAISKRRTLGQKTHQLTINSNIDSVFSMGFDHSRLLTACSVSRASLASFLWRSSAQWRQRSPATLTKFATTFLVRKSPQDLGTHLPRCTLAP